MLSIIHALALVAVQVPAPESAGVSPDWRPTFGGHTGVLGGRVSAATAFDDGSGAGPALYLGGLFTSAGGRTVNNVAKWDGEFWAPLGCGLDGEVFALEVFDDGSGPALYAGGIFTTSGGAPARRVAKWDGLSWEEVGGGVGGVGAFDSVSGFAVHDDGGGARLYAVGWFSLAGPSVLANHIARWDGTQWSAVGNGLASNGRDLEVFDDGSGPALYASVSGAGLETRVSKWDGTTWSGTGSGIAGSPGSLEVFDDGSGPALYTVGLFAFTGAGVPAKNVARWDGTSWSGVGKGLNSGTGAVFVHDDGSGPALYVGGSFSMVGGLEAGGVVRWDGSTWSPVGEGVGSNSTSSISVSTFAEYDDGTGLALFACGDFDTAGNVGANNVARWKGARWSALGRTGLSDEVRALEVFDDGGGPALYAEGDFSGVDSGIHGLGKWDGESWSSLGGGIRSGTISALEVFDDGQGPALYVGGIFDRAGTVVVENVARWDGAGWSPLGQGVDQVVDVLLAHDDGSGPALYAGGLITSAGGVSASGVARWDGTSWSPLGAGTSGRVMELASFDDGSGAALYAGGQFAFAGGGSIPNIAKWDGTAWSALGAGINGLPNALAVYDEGSGPVLFVGGSFTMINGSQPVGGIATWDGTTWSAVGTGPGFTGGPNVFEVHDDGSGERLYAGGGFTAVGGVAAKRAAAWDGVVWTKLGPGPRGNVGALASFEDGGVRTLFVGGDFIAAPSGDSFLAAWGVDSGPVSYCPAGMSASGCFAQLGWFGEPSATASSGFTVSTDSVESSKDGVFFFGTNGRQTVQWGNGTSYRCVVSPVKRAVPMSGLGAPGTCCGFFSMDLNALWCATCPKPAHNPGAGATVQLQLWYRDPQNTSNRTSSFSNAIEFQVSP